MGERKRRTGLIGGGGWHYSSEWEIESRRGQSMGLRSRKVRLDEILGGEGQGNWKWCVVALNLKEFMWMCLYLEWGVWRNSVWCKRYLGSKARANICSTYV